ncbi:MAG: protease modulator HflC [Opitutales bacterium]|nr:protease modulator HflC [Opitutales bacterium]MCH8541532.1 protease modulator HflC [Opitutales bacterium]
MKFSDKNANVQIPVIAGGVLVLLLLVLAFFSLYTVREWEQAVVTQFGEVVGEPVTEAGLKFKLPYHKVQIYDKRLLRWDGSRTDAITRDRKQVEIDVSARWRIVDARRFRESVTTESQAHNRISSNIDGAVRDQIANVSLYEVIRSSNRILEADTDIADTLDADEMDDIDVEEIATLGADLDELDTDVEGNYLAGRPVVIERILEDARDRLAQMNLGIELEDVLIKQLNYHEDVEETVFAQMNAELSKISAGIRSAGRRLAEERLGEMERDLASISSSAQERAQRIRGRAEATAIEIYAEAYNRDPKFYQFIRTLESYEKILGENSSLVLSTDSPLYELLNSVDQLFTD